MTSDPDDVGGDPLDVVDLGPELPVEAPEADVLEQQLPPTGYDPEPIEEYDVPAEADLADVEEQHRSVGDRDADDYR